VATWPFSTKIEDFKVDGEIPIFMQHNASVSSREKDTLTFSKLGHQLKKIWRHSNRSFVSGEIQDTVERDRVQQDDIEIA
jgi:hypothetical protein